MKKFPLIAQVQVCDATMMTKGIPPSLINLLRPQATCFPSGDHKGMRSAVPELWVMFLTSPFSTGMVNISSQASNIIRLPVGDRKALVALLVAFSERVSAYGMSPVTVIIACLWRVGEAGGCPGRRLK